MRKYLALSLIAFGLCAPALAQEAAPAAPSSPGAPAAAAPSTLAGGANASSETHGDWTVDCRTGQQGKDCAMSQALGDSQSGQRVLALELGSRSVDRSEGMLLAPFGLRLAEGVQLTVDGTALGAKRSFVTCIPTGCLVPVTFDQTELSALRAGTVLEVSAIGADATQPIKLNVSLKGFTAAHNRTVELSQ